MQGNIIKCKSCGMEFTHEEHIAMHRIKAHGDIDAIKSLPDGDKQEMIKKVSVRNLYLSEIALDIIALQVDLDVPTVARIIEEIKKDWLV